MPIGVYLGIGGPSKVCFTVVFHPYCICHDRIGRLPGFGRYPGYAFARITYERRGWSSRYNEQLRRVRVGQSDLEFAFNCLWVGN
jgi:hypothetical protein